MGGVVWRGETGAGQTLQSGLLLPANIRVAHAVEVAVARRGDGGGSEVSRGAVLGNGSIRKSRQKSGPF